MKPKIPLSQYLCDIEYRARCGGSTIIVCGGIDWDHVYIVEHYDKKGSIVAKGVGLTFFEALEVARVQLVEYEKKKAEKREKKKERSK